MKVLKSALASFIATIVLSASGIALAVDNDAVEVTDNSVVVADTQADNVEDTTEGDSDVSDDSQPGEDTDSDTDSGVTWSDCSTYNDADGNLVQRCKGEDADGNQVVKSNIVPDEKKASPEEKKDSPKASQPKVSTNSNSQRQTSRAVTSQSAWALSRSVTDTGTGTGVNLPVTFSKDKDSDEEKPKLPRTCGVTKATATSAKPVYKCEQAAKVNAVAKVASAVLVTDNALVTASSRASLFTLVACAAFALVGAGSVVRVRRLNH